MQPAGQARIDVAKANGWWTLYDDVEDLVEPPDLGAAFDADPQAPSRWDGFPPSSRKGILWWIESARRAPTRAKRIAETARLAALGVRASFPEARGR